jgi:hypothetical protein
MLTVSARGGWKVILWVVVVERRRVFGRKTRGRRGLKVCIERGIW